MDAVRLLHVVRRFVANVFRRASVERDLDDEIRAYLSLLIDEKVRGGMSPEAARRAALIELGGAEHVKDEVRDTRAGAALDGWLQDARSSLAHARRNPSHAALVMICIALGVSATTLMFTAVYGVLLRPLPYPDPDRLVVVRSAKPDTDARTGVSWADVVTWNAQGRAVRDLGVWDVARVVLGNGSDGSEQLVGAAVSSGVLRALEIRPVAGRLIDSADQRFGNHRVIILSHALWQRRFRGDTGIVGRNVTITAGPAPPSPYRVIGITPPGVSFPDGAQFWVPLDFDDGDFVDYKKRRYAAAIGRLTRGSTMRDARAELGFVSRRLAVTHPATNAAWTTDVDPLRDYLVGGFRTPVLLFQGAGLLVLLIACANVANLALARGVARQREMAVRIAIGGTRLRLVRQILIENVMLALAGGIAGSGLAAFGAKLLPLAFPDGAPAFLDFDVDTHVIVFGLTASLFSGTLFGMLPALRATRISPADVFRNAGFAGGRGQGASHLRGLLVSAEIALSLMLVVGATLMLRGASVLNAEIGIDPAGALSVSVPMPSQRYEGAARERFYSDLSEGLRALPRVSGVGWSAAHPPLSQPFPYQRVPVSLNGAPIDTASGRADAIVIEASPGYLSVLGASMTAGHGFEHVVRPASPMSTPLAAIVNESFVNRFLQQGDAVGQRVDAVIPGAWSMGARRFTIVGVVRDVRLERPPVPIAPTMFVYAPFGMNSQRLVMRVRDAHPADLVPSINAVVHRLDPTLATPIVETFDTALARGLWRERAHERVLLAFAALAFVLTLTGVYGVIDYSVAQRRAEFGVRLALGATPRRLMMLVVRQGLQLAVAGAVAGIAAAIAAMRLLRGVLYGVSPHDPATLTGVSCALVGIAVVAALVPAWRAARNEPMSALRQD